jgi:DNA-binding CsgD family transcriptional regulator/plastocyanin
VLTPAEWRVLEYVREGMPNAEIAVRLGLSVATVKSRVSSTLAKTGAADRGELATWSGTPAQQAAPRAARGFALPLVGWLWKGATTSALGRASAIGAGTALLLSGAAGAYALLNDDLEGDTVAVIDGVQVTTEQWARALENHDAILACAERALTSESDQPARDFHDLRQSHTREAIVLAGLVLSRATEAEARRQGLMPTAEEIAPIVERRRQLLEELLQREPESEDAACGLDTIRSEIARAGEARYWNEVLPGGVRRGEGARKLYEAHGANLPIPHGGPYGFGLARDAHVQLSTSLREMVSHAQVMAYIDEYEELLVKHAPPGVSSDPFGQRTIGPLTYSERATLDYSGRSALDLNLENYSIGGVEVFDFAPTFIQATPDQVMTLVLRNASTATHNFTLPAQSIVRDVAPGTYEVVDVTMPAQGGQLFYCRFHTDRGMNGQLLAGQIEPQPLPGPARQQSN